MAYPVSLARCTGDPSGAGSTAAQSGQDRRAVGPRWTAPSAGRRSRAVRWCRPAGPVAPRLSRRRPAAPDPACARREALRAARSPGRDPTGRAAWPRRPRGPAPAPAYGATPLPGCPTRCLHRTAHPRHLAPSTPPSVLRSMVPSAGRRRGRPNAEVEPAGRQGGIDRTGEAGNGPAVLRDRAAGRRPAAGLLRGRAADR